MRSIHFNAGFHFFSMGVALAVGLAGGIVFEQQKPQPLPRLVDATEYGVVGIGCGSDEQYAKLFFAKEEDDLPGPRCDVVKNMREVD